MLLCALDHQNTSTTNMYIEQKSTSTSSAEMISSIGAVTNTHYLHGSNIYLKFLVSSVHLITWNNSLNSDRFAPPFTFDSSWAVLAASGLECLEVKQHPGSKMK